jgi:CheY-like chemotaxis protein
VVLERVNSHLEISVTDTGQGIDPDFLPHVFDRFRQADASSTREHRGLGLGLAIVKNLSELHGGSVRAKSPGLNQGSTFAIALPMVTADIDPQRRHPRAATGESFDGKLDLREVRVLAVDDEADARHLIKRILAGCGAQVDTADSGATALRRLQSNKPDVLIMDIGMPQEDGYASMKKVRQLSAENGGTVPAIALTAFARSEDRRRAIMSGFQMHLAKPVEPAELIAMVASLAGRT